MIDKFGPTFERNSENVAFAFIKDRIGAATPLTERSVVDLLETKDLSDVFPALVKKLSRRRKRYKTLGALRARDREVLRTARNTLPHEVAGRDDALSRPYQGRPSALEYFFLTLLTLPEWKQFCDEVPEREEITTASGGLLLRGAIQHVFGDRSRTRAFIDAVQGHLKERGGKPKQIYDIGCGPFPVLAIAAALASPNTRITCLEINPLSAKIADRIVHKLRLEDQISVVNADALSASIPRAGSIDLLISETVGAGLMDEQITRILPRYSRALNAENGAAIPSRVRLSAALIPNDKGVSTKDKTAKYEFVLSENGEYLPILEEEWRLLTSERGADLTKPIPLISGTLPIPDDMSLEQLDGNFRVGVCAELILDQGGHKKLPRYESTPTSPGLIGFVTVPPELKEKNPADLEIRFSYAPGTRSDTMKNGKIKVVQK